MMEVKERRNSLWTWDEFLWPCSACEWTEIDIVRLKPPAVMIGRVIVPRDISMPPTMCTALHYQFQIPRRRV